MTINISAISLVLPKFQSSSCKVIPSP